MQIFELVGSILLKDNGVEGQLDKYDKKASNTSKGMGISFGSIASAALKAATVIGAGLGIKEMMDTAIKGQDRLAQMDAVLLSTKGAAGMTKDELLKLADAQSKLSLNSKGANMETENLLLTFTSIGKDVFPQALTTVNDMSQALGQDTKSSAIQLGKALQDPIKGVTALSRVGVNFTAEQKEQIKTMVASGDTMGAQKVILAELGKEFGGSALSASKTFDGQMTILKNSLKGMGGSIANTVLPYLTQFATWVNDHMPQIQKFMTDALKVIGEAFKNVADFVSTNLMPVFKDIQTWVIAHMPEIKQFISDMVDIVVPKFKKIVDIVKDIAGKIFPDFKAETTNISNEVKSFTNTALNIVITALTWVRDNVPLVKGVLAALTTVWVIHKGVVLAHNIIQAAHNIHLAYTNALLSLASIRTGAMTIAQGAQTIATGAGTIAMGAFNLVMSLNPIVLVIASLALLGTAIYEVVKHWKDICTWIQNAWDKLNIWNRTPANNKNATVTTNYKDTGATGGLTKSHNATGTDSWQGGETWVNEIGGEIMDLPTGTRIIPHDVSMEMAKNSKGNGDGLTLTITNFINNRKQDVEELMREMEMIRKMYSNAKGGTT